MDILVRSWQDLAKILEKSWLRSCQDIANNCKMPRVRSYQDCQDCKIHLREIDVITIELWIEYRFLDCQKTESK